MGWRSDQLGAGASVCGYTVVQSSDLTMVLGLEVPDEGPTDELKDENPLQVSISGQFDKTLVINQDDNEDSDMFANDSSKEEKEVAKMIARENELWRAQREKVRMNSFVWGPAGLMGMLAGLMGAVRWRPSCSCGPSMSCKSGCYPLIDDFILRQDKITSALKLRRRREQITLRRTAREGATPRTTP